MVISYKQFNIREKRSYKGDLTNTKYIYGYFLFFPLYDCEKIVSKRFNSNFCPIKFFPRWGMGFIRFAKVLVKDHCVRKVLF